MDTAVIEGLSAKPKMPRGQKDMRKHKIGNTMIEHLHDGSHKMTFHNLKPGVEATTHSAPNMEAMHDKLEEMLGGKPTEKEMAE